MKNTVFLLFKKDAIERGSWFRRKDAKKDFLGLVSSVLLLLVIFSTVIYVFASFCRMYVGFTFEQPSQRELRVAELLTAVFAFVFILNLVVGVRKIHSSICDSKDVDVLISQPISAWSLFFYKLVKIYFSQVVSSALVLIPCCVTIDVVAQINGGAVYYLWVLFSVIFVPVITCAISSLLSVPYTAIKRLVDANFVVHLVIYIVVIALCSFVYAKFLDVLTTLIRDGQLQYAFELNTILLINEITTNLYPANLFANMLLGVDVGFSILVCLGACAVCAVVAYFLIKRLYNKILQRHMEGHAIVFRKKHVSKQHGTIVTLLKKELIVVLRTPSYAFQFFATAATLPFMVYVCSSLLQSMMKTIIVLDCNFALAIFTVSMFSIITNTFCTTNVSRDGKMFAMLKTMPVTIRQIMQAKILFCLSVCSVSVFACSLVFYFTQFLNALQSLFLFVVGVALCFAEIAYATKKDMKHPAFPTSANDELQEGNSNMSLVTLLGLVFSIISGAGAVILAAVLSIVSNQVVATLCSMGFVALVVVAFLVSSVAYLRKGLNELYYNTEY